MGEGGHSIGMFNVGATMIYYVFSPSSTLDVPMEFGENSLKACFIKVPRDDMNAVQMSPLLFIYHELTLAFGWM